MMFKYEELEFYQCDDDDDNESIIGQNLRGENSSTCGINDVPEYPSYAGVGTNTPHSC